MAKKSRRRGQPWWRRKKLLRRGAMIVVVALTAAAVVWLLARPEGESGKTQYLREPAPAFSLPTIAGDEVSLSQHAGRHPLLLYFNEGMG